MLKQAKVFDFERNPGTSVKSIQKIKLSAGRTMTISSSDTGEVIQLLESGGEVSVRINMAESGPVVSVHCGKLELQASESITLSAKKVEISAEESAVIKSKGALELASTDKMGLKAEDDIAINGKIIHLN